MDNVNKLMSLQLTMLNHIEILLSKNFGGEKDIEIAEDNNKVLHYILVNSKEKEEANE